MENITISDDPIHYFKSHHPVGDITNLGLNKREYFASLALQGILANRELQLAIISDYKGIDRNNAWSDEAVNQADLLIKALNK